jgi:GNAT superfamily N-acetyltransferase
VEAASEELQDRVFREIKMGTIFSTDRIALDSHFSVEIAGNRYYNWMRQELDRGAALSISYYKEEPVAFSITKPAANGVCDGIMGGVFAEHRNRGLGFLAIEATNQTAEKYGAKKIQTKVSSNNLPILRLHVSGGYEIVHMEEVLVKHV